METYMKKVRTNLYNAKDELQELINMLDDFVIIDNKIFKETDIRNISKELNVQVNNINYNIIPAIKRL